MLIADPNHKKGILTLVLSSRVSALLHFPSTRTSSCITHLSGRVCFPRARRFGHTLFSFAFSFDQCDATVISEFRRDFHQLRATRSCVYYDRHHPNKRQNAVAAYRLDISSSFFLMNGSLC